MVPFGARVRQMVPIGDKLFSPMIKHNPFGAVWGPLPTWAPPQTTPAAVEGVMDNLAG